MMSRQAPSGPGTETSRLATFTEYSEAQRTVDQLSDAGFPVDQVSIVWNRLRHVEHVTGRLTILGAAARGAASGAWFGLLFGFLMVGFAELDNDTEPFAVVLTYVLLGALFVALWAALRHWGKQGTRDFSTRDRLDAESFDVWVHRDHLAEATRITGTTTERAMDP